MRKKKNIDSATLMHILEGIINDPKDDHPETCVKSILKGQTGVHNKFRMQHRVNAVKRRQVKSVGFSENAVINDLDSLPGARLRFAENQGFDTSD